MYNFLEHVDRSSLLTWACYLGSVFVDRMPKLGSYRENDNNQIPLRNRILVYVTYGSSEFINKKFINTNTVES